MRPPSTTKSATPWILQFPGNKPRTGNTVAGHAGTLAYDLRPATPINSGRKARMPFRAKASFIESN